MIVKFKFNPVFENEKFICLSLIRDKNEQNKN